MSAPRATPTATNVTLRTSTPPTLTAWFSGAIELATSPSWPSRRSMISATACNRNAIANVVTSITAGDEPARRVRERVGAGHDQLSVGEVDEAQDPEDEPDADRHQRVDRAQPERVAERLEIDRGENAHEAR